MTILSSNNLNDHKSDEIGRKRLERPVKEFTNGQLKSIRKDVKRHQLNAGKLSENK